MEGRPPGPYNPAMPILEALTALAYMAAVTTRVTLGTEVLVLPQRQPALVAKQVSTLDTLSGGRMRLGVGVGWQESEYHALGESFRTRGARMDEAIRLLRAYWSEAHVSAIGPHYPPRPWRWSRSRPRAGACRSGSAATPKPRIAASAGSGTAGWRAAWQRRAMPGRPSRAFTGTPTRRAAIPPPSACRAWWLLHPRRGGQDVLRGPRGRRRAGRRASDDGVRLGRAERDRHFPGRCPYGRRHHRRPGAPAREDPRGDKLMRAPEGRESARTVFRAMTRWRRIAPSRFPTSSTGPRGRRTGRRS